MPSATQLHVWRDLAVGTRHMVAAKHPLAVHAALDVLQRGGNAVDAAVTAAFAVGVVEPWMSGLGGGGFMTVQMRGGERAVIDYFARAPIAAGPDLYALTTEFSPDGVGFSGVANAANAYGALSIATPGTVRGMALALERFGTRGLAECLQPAIELADGGFEVDWYQAMLMASEQEVIRRDPETARIFLVDGLPAMPRFGGNPVRLRQPELAQTLRRIARDGADAFYVGEIAERIVSHVQAAGGVLSRADLAEYQPRLLEPLVMEYRGVDLVLVPFQGGGTHTAEALGILSGFDLAGTGHNTAASLHLLAEASRRATVDRLACVGDPDFVEVDWAHLTSVDHAAELRTTIDPARVSGVSRERLEGGCTTHLSVVDAHGNMVSLTQTLTLLFGSGVTVPGTGVLLNDSMNLFDPRAGGPNAIAPRKRPVSNMAHLIAVRDGVPILAIGAPGGRRILDTCLQMAIDVLDFGLDVQSACAAPLIDCAGPALLADDRLPEETLHGLRERGHVVEPVTVAFAPRHFASPTGVAVDPSTGLRTGGADPWAIGIAAGV
jgi:gamma-glutamyltranspeptidase / glutathione hydrolase